MRAPRTVEETRYLPITLLDNPENLEVARMVTLCAIARDAVDLGKDTLAEAFERERMHAPQHFPIRFLNLLHSVPVHWGSASVTREAAACVGPGDAASQVSIEFAIGVCRQHGEAYANKDLEQTLYHVAKTGLLDNVQWRKEWAPRWVLVLCFPATNSRR